jgi:hypothetical protein
MVLHSITIVFKNSIQFLFSFIDFILNYIYMFLTR